MFPTQTINYTANRGHGVRIAVTVAVFILPYLTSFQITINGVEYADVATAAEVADALRYRLTAAETRRVMRKLR